MPAREYGRGKWAYKLLPLVDSTLVMDCFDLAWDARELDMRAAPHDIRDWGYEPIPVETTEGKAEYVRTQRELSERSIELRASAAGVRALSSTPEA